MTDIQRPVNREGQVECVSDIQSTAKVTYITAEKVGKGRVSKV